MLVQTTASAYVDYLRQLGALLRDPVCYGRGVRRGDGEPVLLIPGYIAGDWTLATLAGWLRRMGYRPYLSGIDVNLGCPRRTVEMLRWRVAKIAEETGRGVAIVGHSLGGLLGRALGGAAPGLVHHVVALGSPIREGWGALTDEVRPVLRAMHAVWQTISRSPKHCGTEECECGIVTSAFARLPKQTRFSSIFTRDDEVVDWQSCLAPDEGVNYEVTGLHASLIVNPEVYRLLASILAEDVESTQVAVG